MKYRFVLIVSVMLIVGCGGSLRPMRTPDFDDTPTEFNSVGRYEKCKADLYKLMEKMDPRDPRYAELSFEIEQKCHDRTAAAPSMGYDGAFVPNRTIAVQFNGAYNNGIIPWNGNPTYAVAVPPPPPPAAPQPQGKASKPTVTDKKAMAAVVRELDRHAEDICALKKSQGLSCDEATK